MQINVFNNLLYLKINYKLYNKVQGKYKKRIKIKQIN